MARGSHGCDNGVALWPNAAVAVMLVWSEMAAVMMVTAAAVMVAWPETAAVLVMALHETAAVR